MDEIAAGNNYLGRLMELGTKCKFVVNPEIVNVPVTSNSPAFKCTIRICDYDILVEQIAANKKAAKAAAAQIALEKICEKIQEPNSSPVDKIAVKLKDLEVLSDKITITVEFYKKLASLDVSKVNVANGNSFADLRDLLSDIQFTVSYKHVEFKANDGSVEYQFVCEIRPSGSLSPLVVSCGFSSENTEEAKTKAVNQLLALLKVYSSQ